MRKKRKISFFRKFSNMVNGWVRNSFKSVDDSHEFLPILSEIEQEPINPLGQTMFWTLVALITFTVVWMVFGKADVVVSGRGKIIPEGEVKILQPLEEGVVKNILVKEGDFVKKGQILVEIDPSTSDPEVESYKANLDYINIERKRLRATTRGQSFGKVDSIEAQTQKSLYQQSVADLHNQLRAKESEIKSINEEISDYRKQLSINSRKESRMQEVSDIIARNDLDKVHSENTEYRSKIAVLTHQRAGTQKEFAHIRSDFNTQHLEELANLDKQANELEANMKTSEFRRKQRNIIAPVDGYVNTLAIHTIGGVVTPGEKLVTFVPKDAPLIIKVSISNRDIGFIKVDMPVLVKVDTFEFQKYGIINGVVKEISKDSIETLEGQQAREQAASVPQEKQEATYDVYVTPLNKTLMVEGKETPISTGMSLTAEIKINQRRIIEFFIYPMIKYWNQAITVR